MHADQGPRTSDPKCATAPTAMDGTWTETARPTHAPLRHRPQVGLLPPPHLPRRLATSDHPPHPPRSPPPPSLRPIPWHLPRPALLRPTPDHQHSPPAASPFAMPSWPLPLLRHAPPRDCFPNPWRDRFPTLRLLVFLALSPGGAQPYASALLGAPLVSRPPPLANNGSPSHTEPPPRRHLPAPAVHGLQAASHAPVSPPACRNVRNDHAPSHTSVSPIRCSPSLDALATAVMRACTALLLAKTCVCAAVLYMLRRMLNYPPAMSDPPPLPAPLHAATTISPPPSPPGEGWFVSKFGLFC